MKQVTLPSLLLPLLFLFTSFLNGDAFVHVVLPTKSQQQNAFLFADQTNETATSGITSAPKRSKNIPFKKRISELKRYKKMYGTVNVPNTHFLNKDEWSGIAIWVRDVRQGVVILSEEEHAQLIAMGLKFKGTEAKQEKHDKYWDKMFGRLLEYNQTHGNLLVPTNYTSDKALGRWVYTQRRFKKLGRLTAEKEERLNDIKFVWVVKENDVENTELWDKRWKEKLDQLIQFYEENDHFWVPRNSENRTIKALSLGEGTQRDLYKRGELREDREAKFETE